MEDILLQFGDAVKSVGPNRLGGYLVRFSTPDDPDLVGDFFTADTGFGVKWDAKSQATIPVFFNHGQDEVLDDAHLGFATLTKNDEGLWIEWEMQQEAAAAQYRAALAALGRQAAKNNLGWSSGAPGHLVRRVPVERNGQVVAHQIKTWVLSEASVTPNPCEPRNSAVPLKAWQEEATSFKSILEDALEAVVEEEDDAATKTADSKPLSQLTSEVVTALDEWSCRLQSRVDFRLNDEARKSGRVLSQANMAAIEGAISSLQAVLSAARREEQAEAEAATAPVEDKSPPDPLKSAEAPAEPAEELLPESEVRRLYADFQQAEALLTRVGAGAY